MFCKYCGVKLIDEAAFCHECGKATHEQPAQPVIQPPVPPVQIVYQHSAPPVQPVFPQNVPPQYTYTVPAPPVQTAPQPAVETDPLAQLEKQALTFGILGLSLSMLGVPGIIFSSIAGKKANAYKKLTGSLTEKATTGYRLAKAGKIVSIIMTVILTLLVLTLQGEVTYEYNNPFEYYDF